MTYQNTLAALADPTRQKILEHLRSGPRSVGQLAVKLPVSRPAVSQHLRILKEVNLVSEKHEGTRRIYAVEAEGLADLQTCGLTWRGSGRMLWPHSKKRLSPMLEERMPADESDTTIAPVRKTVIVRCDIHEAFRMFTEEFASWWPLETHSVGRDSADTCGIEGHAGGRLYERGRDGKESVWGEVLRWDPPHVLEFTWHPGLEPDSAQTVEVTFTATGEDTRVELTHSGWASLGERALETRQNYDSGWDMVFVERYGARCAA